MNRVALITGGTRGIGLGIAKCLSMEGFELILNGIRAESEVEHVTSALRKEGIRVYYIQGNTGIEHDRNEIIHFTREKFGRLDILVNNAGIAPRERKDILETTLDSFEEVLNVNLTGPYFLTQLAANWMIAQGKRDINFRGIIVNISSISATVASVNRGEYCISKAGMSMVTKLFAARLGEYNIPVYEVRPGVVDTDMTAGAKEKYDRLIGEGLCVQKRWGKPEDVGRAVASLVRGDFPYSTGQVIMVDGGLTISRL
ncbi:MAG: 3-ketoacyl-ACP reductase [Cyclobacteriaceae bacterium]|nr:3-ketoacyl-ACP reductase [Cyclobacteriaceae bacterium]